TESTKQCLAFIAECTSSDNSVEQKLLSTNPILESFGNAKTVRNNNSSRFGKYIQIYFDGNGKIVGATNTNYLLEKIRVVQCVEIERNYHIFYQLVKAADAKMVLRDISNYGYLKGVSDVPGINDVHDFGEVLTAMTDIGLDSKEVNWVMQMCAAILWLGNVTIESKEKDVGITQKSSSITEAGQEALQIASSLLGLPPQALAQALTNRTFAVRGGAATLIGLSQEEALTNRDSLSKYMYDRMFDWIVNRLNKALQLQDYWNIGYFWFEIFEHNSFEQLCINFTNEKLQQHFDEHTFKMEEMLYRKEGINFDSVNYVDNQPILDLIEKKKTGLLPILDEQTRMPKTNDQTTFQAFCLTHKATSHFKPFVKKDGHFVITHYAGEVVYDVTCLIISNILYIILSIFIYFFGGQIQKKIFFFFFNLIFIGVSAGFLDKNRDSLQADLIALLGKAQFEFIPVLFPDAIDSSKTKKLSLGAQFQEQLNSLMTTLHGTEPHYIRCIKPNSDKLSDKFVVDIRLIDFSITNQTNKTCKLTYSGVFEAVKIRKSGYPFRKDHSDFWKRYRVVNLNKKYPDDRKKACQILINDMKMKGDVQLGNTMVLYRAEEHNEMELKRNIALNSTVEFLQRVWRRWDASHLYVEMKRVKPILDAAIAKREIQALEDAISETANVEYDMKLIRYVSYYQFLKQRLIREKELLEDITKMLDLPEIDNVVEDLRKLVAEAKELEINNELVQDAEAQIEIFEAKQKATRVLTDAIEEIKEEKLKEGINLAELAGYLPDEPLLVKAKQLVASLEKEREIITVLEELSKKGGYIQEGDAISYEELQVKVEEAERFGSFRVEKNKEMVERCKALVKLRTVVEEVLESKEQKDMDRLKELVETMARTDDSWSKHAEIVGANAVLHKFFNNEEVEQLQDAIGQAMSEMDHVALKFQLDEAKRKQIDETKAPVLTDAAKLLESIEEIRRLLTEGMKETNLMDVRDGLQKAANIGYSKAIVKKADSYFTQLNSFHAKAEAALQSFNINEMKNLLDVARQWNVNNEQVTQMKDLVFNTSPEKLLQMQLAKAVQNKDTKLVCKITYKLKTVFFEKNSNKFEWDKFPKLLNPKAWAKTARTPFGRDKLRTEFFVFTKNPIHHPLTDLRTSTEKSDVTSTAVSKFSVLKNEALQMFKNIMGYMGDRHYAQPILLVRDIVKKCMTHLPLRNEVFCQLIKQLTKNPRRVSEERGWNLMVVLLDTFAPSTDLENYLEHWLRTNPPPHKHPQFFVALLHQTMFQGSRTEVPSTEEIDSLLRGK
ncbi:Rab GTPase binding protein, partial [Reticulomyxa filosa]